MFVGQSTKKAQPQNKRAKHQPPLPQEISFRIIDDDHLQLRHWPLFRLERDSDS